MGAYSGVVRNPRTGRLVEWTLAPGLIKLGRQLDKLRITWYSIGNADHLARQPGGGHTPWKPGAPAGMVTAIDVMKTPDGMVEAAILRLMRMATYDTSWIDFINTNGSQYDFDGRRQGSSGDFHLHLECLGQHTSFTSNLFYDMFGWPTGSKPPVTVKQTTPPVVVHTDPDPQKEAEMFLVKLSSRGDVWKAEGGKLHHLTPAQFKVATGLGMSIKTVGTEEELAFYGTEIVPQAVQVEGLG